MGEAKRGGRPRRDPRALSRPADEEILHQAAKLFALKRFERTSTREIAEASGLQQSSLFHYFKTKADILIALSERANVQPLDNLERIEASGLSPAAKLYRLVEEHMWVANADRGAWRAVLENSHALPPARFRRYQAQEERYSGGVRSIIAAGIADGTFVDEPAGLAAARILGMCNWSLRFVRRSGRLTGDEVAAHFAAAAVRSLLRDPTGLDAVVAEAAAAVPPREAPTT